MRPPRGAALRSGAACLLAATLLPCGLRAQPVPRTALDQLVSQAVEQVRGRYARALGSVSERRRDRVFVLMRNATSPPGTRLEVTRNDPKNGGERVVARLEVLNTQAGLTECRQTERVGRAQSEPGDIVRAPQGSVRLLVAPCVALVEMPAEIPEVLGERIRIGLLSSPAVRVVDDPQAERRAEAAYLSNAAADFVARQVGADEVLYPVLLQTPGKLVLNLEYASVERGRTTEIDVATVPLDDLLRAWLRAGRTRLAAPPGFKRLPAQVQPWDVIALAEAAPGDLLVVEPDSVHVLEFSYPGLRRSASAALGPRQRHRRAPLCTVVTPRMLESSGDLAPAFHVLGDERRAQSITWTPGSGETLVVRPAPAGLEDALERLWSGIRPASRRQDARWWPAPGQQAVLYTPCFVDIDLDGRLDAVWSGADAALGVKLSSQRNARTFPGFGDVKAVQPPRTPGGRAVLWLTDPVWHGASDRLHAAELAGGDLEVHWSSEPFEGTLHAVASADLNADGTPDLVVGEALPAGTRLHVFLAFPGERTPRNATAEGGGRR